MSMVPLEARCLQQVYELRAALAGQQAQAKKTFKLVNAMLQVLDHDGFYGAVVYLEVYRQGDKPLGLLGALNRVLDPSQENGLEGQVDRRNLNATKNIYRSRYANGDELEYLAQMILRRLLIYLRFEIKASLKH
jgi:hypothetical protein